MRGPNYGPYAFDKVGRRAFELMDCPHCGAAPGWVCRSRGGQFYGGTGHTTHLARRTAVVQLKRVLDAIEGMTDGCR